MTGRNGFPERAPGHRSPAEDLEHVARLFLILSLLRERRPGQPIGVRDIAAGIGLSERHTQRHLNILKASDLAQYDRSERSYLLTDAGARFPGVALDGHDVLALALAASLLAGEGVPERERIQAAFARIVGGWAVPEPLRDLFAAVARAVAPFSSGRLATDAPLMLIVEAAAHRRTVEIDYTTASTGARAIRRIDPYGVEMQDGRSWHVQAWCHHRQAFRTFALKWMHTARDTGATFPFRDAEWAAFRSQAGVFSGLRGGPEIPVRVRFDPEVARYALCHPWPDGLEITEQPDGSALLSGAACGVDGILIELLRWRRHAQVLDGPELRARITEEIRAMSAHYDETPPLSQRGTSRVPTKWVVERGAGG